MYNDFLAIIRILTSTLVIVVNSLRKFNAFRKKKDIDIEI